MPELNDEHYLRAVTGLGDISKIVADRDIYSENGTKLVTAGVEGVINFVYSVNSSPP